MNVNTQQPKTMVEAVKAYEAICRAARPDDENWFAPDDMVRAAPIRTTEDLAAFIEFLKAEALSEIGTDRTDIRTFDDIDGRGFDWEGMAVFKLAREAANFLPVSAADLGIHLHEVAEKWRAEAIQDQADYLADIRRKADALSPIQHQALKAAADWPRSTVHRDFGWHVVYHACLFIGQECRPDVVGQDAFDAKVQDRAKAIQDAFPDLTALGLVKASVDGFTAELEGRTVLDAIN